MKSGIKNYTILKTTQSGFENFHRDEFRTLPDTNDRLMGTSVDAEWTYTKNSIGINTMDYRKNNTMILDGFDRMFSGPADKGVYSVSVQATAYDMGCEALRVVPGLDFIHLFLPNIHNIPMDFAKFNLTNKDHTGQPDVFLPTSEPFGVIEVTVERNLSPSTMSSRL